MRAMVIRTLSAKMEAGTITDSERFALKAAQALDAQRPEPVLEPMPSGVIDLAAARARRQGQ